MVYVPEIWDGTTTLIPVTARQVDARVLVWPLYATPPGAGAALLASRWPEKRVSAVLDFSLDLTDWLEVDGDTIASAAVNCDDDMLAIGDVAITDTIAKVWLSAGAAGTDYVLTWTITTAAGRIVNPVVRLLVTPDSPTDLYLTDGAGNILTGPVGDILIEG